MKNKRDNLSGIIIIVVGFLILLGAALIFYFDPKFFYNEKVGKYLIIFFFAACFIGYFIFFIIHDIPKVKEIKETKNFLKENYPDVEVKRVRKIENIPSDRFLGSLRKNYFLETFVPKYNCKIKYFFLQELTEDSVWGKDGYDDYVLEHKNRKAQAEYIFPISSSNYSLSKDIIDKFYYVDICIKDNTCIITKDIPFKEEVSKDEMEINMKDVELFYEEIVSKLEPSTSTNIPYISPMIKEGIDKQPKEPSMWAFEKLFPAVPIILVAGVASLFHLDILLIVKLFFCSAFLFCVLFFKLDNKKHQRIAYAIVAILCILIFVLF